MKLERNTVIELSFNSAKTYADPFNDASLFLEVTAPCGKVTRYPGFWKGGQSWAVRFSAEKEGAYSYSTVCSDASDAGLNGMAGTLEVTGYTGKNPLYKHGRIKANGKYFEHSDGTPFFWLGDTWWMSLCKRMKFPEDLDTIINDRVEKGFTLIQIIAGLYPDMPPFDERGANEAGFPWAEDFSTINPAYFDMMDRRIFKIIDAGLVPCIVGCWGYFIDFAGKEKLVRHWENLIARYAAYPVVWCAAGEGTMAFYGYFEWSDERNEPFLATKKDKKAEEAYVARAKSEWTDIMRTMRAYDPYHNAMSIHPSQFAHKTINDVSVLDFNMLQTGHGGEASLNNTVDMIIEAQEATPDMPVLDTEVNYEGIGGMNGPDAQRFAFLSTVLMGAAGFTYGGNGIWQINRPGQPFGPSPHGLSWGAVPWQETMAMPGSKHIGFAKKLLEKFDWQKFVYHPEWAPCAPETPNVKRIYPVGLPDGTMIFFLPGCYGFTQKTLVKGFTAEKYSVQFIDLISGTEFPGGEVSPKNGEWTVKYLNRQFLPVYADMLLVMKPV